MIGQQSRNSDYYSNLNRQYFLLSLKDFDQRRRRGQLTSNQVYPHWSAPDFEVEKFVFAIPSRRGYQFWQRLPIGLLSMEQRVSQLGETASRVELLLLYFLKTGKLKALLEAFPEEPEDFS